MARGQRSAHAAPVLGDGDPVNRPHDEHTGRSGFSLLEVVIALGLFTVLAVNLTLLTRATERSAGQADDLRQLEVMAAQTLDRVVLALMSARAESIDPLNTAPLNDSEVRYTISTGVDGDGNVVWSDPESIGLAPGTDQVVWCRNPGGQDELRVVWGHDVAAAALGEALGNLTDDNGDGLIDEYGLSFHLSDDGRSVLIQLSLARDSSAGNRIETAARQRVSFRN